MVTNIRLDLDDDTRRLIAQQVDRTKGKRTRGRRLASRAEITAYVITQLTVHLNDVLEATS
jgi:hypothetical protein